MIPVPILAGLAGLGIVIGLARNRLPWEVVRYG